MNPTYFQPR